MNGCDQGGQAVNNNTTETERGMGTNRGGGRDIRIQRENTQTKTIIGNYLEGKKNIKM